MLACSEYCIWMEIDYIWCRHLQTTWNVSVTRLSTEEWAALSVALHWWCCLLCGKQSAGKKYSLCILIWFSVFVLVWVCFQMCLNFPFQNFQNSGRLIKCFWSLSFAFHGDFKTCCVIYDQWSRWVEKKLTKLVPTGYLLCVCVCVCVRMQAHVCVHAHAPAIRWQHISLELLHSYRLDKVYIMSNWPRFC
jgi:hypothetical protein